MEPDSLLDQDDSYESPQERPGSRRSLPGSLSEKSPSMEPSAATPFRVTVPSDAEAEGVSLPRVPAQPQQCGGGAGPQHGGRGGHQARAQQHPWPGLLLRGDDVIRKQVLFLPVCS
uniref:DAB2 interacting protein n=1 Tax=Homo sapiens TaxID=9606 RepID=F6R503_HUMAN